MSGRARAAPPELDPVEVGPGEAKREEILGVALELFAEHGYEGASLQRVADRVALHKSSLFHHFANKEELARAVYSGVGERLRKRVEPLLADDPPSLERILQLSDLLVDHFAEEPSSARLLLRTMVAGPEGSGSFRNPLGDDASATTQLLFRVAEWLDRARRAGVVRRLRVRHTLIEILGIVLFYPAVAHDVGAAVIEGDPMGAEALRVRKRELRQLLRGALAPR